MSVYSPPSSKPNINIDYLLESLPEIYSGSEREDILKAYQFAENAHIGQKRVSGEPYISHCVAVAAILAEMKVPPAVVIAGLLHDTVEDTDVTLNDIRQNFSDEIAKLVDGVTKLTNLPRVSRGDQHFEDITVTTQDPESAAIENNESDIRSRKHDLATETLRKTFLAMGDDIRVVLIKLADRLHNMRTLGFMPEHKRRRIARQTLEIFAPLANRLGIWQLKWELEDLAFRYVNPEKYKEIAENLSERREDREGQIQIIMKKLQEVLEDTGIQAELTGRPKHIYSIYKKIVEKGRPIETMRDLRGVRLIVNDIPECYSALGVIHTHWRPIPHEFDDYIAAPKDNFYQSLHTAILWDDGKPLEVQIRTRDMHQNAEFGIAAHWRYKEKGPRDQLFEQRVNWLRKLMEWRQDVEDAQEFVDGMKTDVFEDRVYVFTPRGDIIDLPNGSTPIDFAYHVHTEIGNRCRGAKVNGKLVTLDTVIHTGDQIEILTAKQGGPSRDWLNPNLDLVRTQRARSKIKFWFKVQDRELNLTQGRSLFERELRRLGITNIDPSQIAGHFDYRNADELYIALGCGDLSIGRIINKLSEEEKEKDALPEIKPLTDVKPDDTSVTVLGLKGLLTNFAKCCHPVPGDEIIGYITRGRGATIHRRDCPNILRQRDQERIVRVTWGEQQRTQPIPIQIKAYDRQGLMVDISNILNNEDANLVDINLKITHSLATINMVVEVGDISQLSRILTRMEALPNVMEAHRSKPG